MANRAFSGPRAQLWIAGASGRQLVGWATGCSGSVNVQQMRIDVLGNPASEEIEPVGFTVAGNFERVRIVDLSLVELGVDPTQGDTINFINFPALNIDVYDQVGETVIESIRGARMSQRTWSVQARGITSEQVAFEALTSTSGVSA
jgi:hypothetical protein